MTYYGNTLIVKGIEGDTVKVLEVYTKDDDADIVKLIQAAARDANKPLRWADLDKNTFPAARKEKNGFYISRVVPASEYAEVRAVSKIAD